MGKKTALEMEPHTVSVLAGLPGGLGRERPVKQGRRVGAKPAGPWPVGPETLGSTECFETPKIRLITSSGKMDIPGAKAMFIL